MRGADFERARPVWARRAFGVARGMQRRLGFDRPSGSPWNARTCPVDARR
jgi:hypothetical protein